MDAETPPSPPRRRWMRVLGWALGALLALLVLLVLLLPALLSSAWVRGLVSDAASEASGRRVVLGDLDVGWGAARVRDLEVGAGAGADSVLSLRVREVRVPAGISAAFASRLDLAPLEVLGPEVRIDLRALSRPAPSPPPREAPGGEGPPAGKEDLDREEVAPFNIEAIVSDGSLLLVDGAGKETRLGTFSARLAASDAGPATLLLEADLGAAGKVRFESEAAPFRDGAAVPSGDVAASLEVVLDALDLSALRGALQATPDLGVEDARGVLSGRLEARTVPGSGAIEGSVSLEARGVLLAGPALRGRVEEPLVSLAAGFRAAREGTGEVRDGTLRIEGLEAKGGGGRLLDGALSGAVAAEGRLDALADRAKRLGLLPAETAVAGAFSFEARAVGDASARRVTGTLRLDGAQISPGPGKAPLDEPDLRGTFDVALEGEGLRIHEATLKSGSVLARAEGTFDRGGAADLKASATVQVARVARIATGLGAPLAGDLSGTAEVEASVKRGAVPGPGDGARASVVVTDLLVFPPGEKGTPLRDPRLELRLDAVPGKEAWEIRSLTAKGEGLSLRVSGRAAADGASGTLETLEADLDLGRADALARALGTELPARLSGAASWRGPVSWERGGDGITAKGAAAVADLVAETPAAEGRPTRTLREARVRAEVDLALEAREGGRETAIRSFAVDADGLGFEAEGLLSADGSFKVDAAGEAVLAAATRRLANLGLIDRDPAPRGTLDFDLGLYGRPGAEAVVLRRLEARDAEFTLAGSGSLSRKGPADLSVAFEAGLAALADCTGRAGLDAIPKGSTGKVSVRVTAKAATPEAPVECAVAASVAGLSLPDPAGGAPWTQGRVAFDGQVVHDRGAERATVEGVLAADDGTARLSGTADLAAGKRRFEAKAVVDLDLGGLTRARPGLLPLEGTELGHAKGTVALRGSLEGGFDPASLEGAARLLLDSVRTEPMTLEKAEVDAGLKGGVVDVRSVTATVNGGAVSARAKIGISGSGPRHALEAKAEGVRIDPAMAFLLRRVVPIFAVGEAGGVSGRLDASLSLEAEGDSWAAAKPTLRGKGTMKVSEGTVGGSGILGEIAEILGGGRTFGFSAVDTEFAVHDQAVWNERLKVDGAEHALVLRGSTGFDGRLDYRVGAKALRIGKKRLERIRPLLDEEGNLPFTLGGTLRKPRLKPPDLKKAAGDLLEDALRKKLKELLGGDD